jgi:hypothetical protein
MLLILKYAKTVDPRGKFTALCDLIFFFASDTPSSEDWLWKHVSFALSSVKELFLITHSSVVLRG